MSLYKTFGTSADLEQSGIWLQYGYADVPEGEPARPIRIRISRAGGNNTKFARIMEAKTRPYRRSIQTETLDNKIAESLFREVYAEAVILGWENVQDADGKDLPFTRENVIKVLTDLPDLYQDIREAAAKATLFRDAELETDSGN